MARALGMTMGPDAGPVVEVGVIRVVDMSIAGGDGGKDEGVGKGKGM